MTRAQPHGMLGLGRPTRARVPPAAGARPVATSTFSFGNGRWYVRAQAQPTLVNANSFWTPNQYYTAP